MARDRKRFLVSLAIALLAASSARAYDEQWSLDAAAGYSLLVHENWPDRWANPQGVGVDLGATLGVSDAVMLRGTLGYAYFASAHRPEHVGRLRAEGLYLLDVLKLVPFLGVGVTLTTAQHSDQELPLRPGVHLVVGADYLATRSWNFGLDVRSGILFESGQLLNSTDISLRASRLFELF
jgi:hypothetical protein